MEIVIRLYQEKSAVIIRIHCKWGTYVNQNYLSKTGWKVYPGDIGYDDGHTWIILGQCSDKSAVIVHSTPNAGCQIAGTCTPDGDS